MEPFRDWKSYNEALVKRGTIRVDLDFVSDWSRELKTMNGGKEGARYRYPESFIKLLAIVQHQVDEELQNDFRIDQFFAKRFNLFWFVFYSFLFFY